MREFFQIITILFFLLRYIWCLFVFCMDDITNRKYPSKYDMNMRKFFLYIINFGFSGFSV